jgi:ribosomal protein L11 methyltransferase
MSDGAWRSLRVRAAAAEVAALEATFEALGALAVSVEAADDVPIFDTLDGDSPTLWPDCVVEALFDLDADIETLLGAVAGAGFDTAGARHVVIADRDWQGVFRDHFPPRAFGPLWVVPSWHAPPAGAARVITLDPGMAFGTGAHATTALCLEWLAGAAAVAGQRVLDYGCGSGILAIAAARLGAMECVGVDIDPAALTVARENASRNDCPSITFCLPGVLRPGAFDVLVANLLLKPVLALAATFAARLPTGGRIGVTGITDTQVDAVCAAYSDAFLPDAPRRDGEWILLTGTRR